MTANTTDDRPDTAAIDSLTDPTALRDWSGVPFHEDTDTVPAETFDAIRAADDMAPVGVTTDGGETLVMRVTADCSWKIPASNVAPEQAFADAAREWVEENTGVPISIDGIAGVWRLAVRPNDGEGTATRHFVVFEASPATDGVPPVPVDDGPERAREAGWFEELPEGGDRVPGTDLFLD